jgi:hypothetical protein
MSLVLFYIAYDTRGLIGFAKEPNRNVEDLGNRKSFVC